MSHFVSLYTQTHYAIVTDVYLKMLKESAVSFSQDEESDWFCDDAFTVASSRLQKDNQRIHNKDFILKH